MQRTSPPFRADHVGSLLRPAALKEARARRQVDEITAEDLKAIEDREIATVIKKQEDVGLQCATDGEFRRSWWHFDFFRGLDGVSSFTTEHGIRFAGVETKAEGIKVTGKVGFSGHPLIGREIYPDLDAYFDDVAAAYRKAIRAFYDAGCRYLQLDDTAWAMMCSAFEREQSKKRGDDPDTLPERYARMTNIALADKPADLFVTMHSCRGNFRSKWIAEGGYEP